MWLIYWSSKSENTKRFIEKINYPNTLRLPLNGKETIYVNQPYILVVPTYGGGKVEGAVPKPVIYFLNDKTNRSYIRGVISAGNRNFGSAYALAGKIIAQKCNVPLLYHFELLGLPEDIISVQSIIKEYQERENKEC